MTTINLNKTLHEQLRDQYKIDLQNECTEYPLSYILFSISLDRNIRYTIKRKVTFEEFTHALGIFLRFGSKSLPENKESALYEDEVLRVSELIKPTFTEEDYQLEKDSEEEGSQVSR